MSGASKEWAIVLAIALLLHAGAGLVWWWMPVVDLHNAGASSIRLALAPSNAPTDDRSETVVAEQETPVLPEPEPDPVREQIRPVAPPEQPITPVVQTKPTPKPDQSSTIEQASAPTSQNNESQQIAETGSAVALTGPADASVASAYKAQLSSWLARHKRYPRAARRRYLEGVAQLTFTLNSEGDVLQYELTGSTGYEVLDKEVVKMLKRAEPLPRFPAGLNRTVREFEIPIRFELERD